MKPKYPWRGCCHEITRATGFVVLPHRACISVGGSRLFPEDRVPRYALRALVLNSLELSGILSSHFKDNIHSLGVAHILVWNGAPRCAGPRGWLVLERHFCPDLTTKASFVESLSVLGTVLGEASLKALLTDRPCATT